MVQRVPLINETEVISSRSFQTILRRALLVPAAVTFILVGALVWQIERLSAEFHAIERSDQTLANIPVAQRTMIDMELNLGKYLVLDDPQARVAYERAYGEMEVALAALDSGLSPNPESSTILTAVHQAVARHRALALVDIARAEESPAARSAPSAGSAPNALPRGGPPPRPDGNTPESRERVFLMPAISRDLAALISIEHAHRQTQVDRTVAAARRTVIGAVSATLLLGLGLAFAGRRQLVRVAAAYQRALMTTTEQAQELQQLASRDGLTGLANRAFFYDRLEAALGATRQHREPLAVFYVDLDGFKGINDRFGHAAGDLLLKLVAARLTAAVRAHDVVARLGGDEFCVLAARLRDRREAESIADRIRSSLNEPYQLDDQIVHVTASCGLAVTDDGAVDADTLVNRSDLALYQAKSAGKDRYVVAA